MAVLRHGVLLIAISITPACVVPFGVPAARFDGGYSPQGNNMRVGTHVAGFRTARNPEWDLGVGYARSSRVIDPAMAQMTDGVAAEPATSAMNGVYIEAAYLPHVEGPSRISLGPVVALMVNGERDELVPVLYLRAGYEVFAPVLGSGSGSGKCGFGAGGWFGEVGLGAYVDVQRPLTDSGMAVTIGLSGRLPAFAGVAVVIPGCR